ncbi:MAG: CPBP family intramembrane metalloprotease [Acidobacteria bacterium]|nr:CPBP family intramembrane metalloprotease [Acidobacteriota bacterium]MCB9399006.1 CPBP family intramembrane metalloprotease [Acidobacteriota bacterium]
MPLSSVRKRYLILELCILFGAVPLLLLLFRSHLRLLLIPLLVLQGGLCTWILWADRGFDRRALGWGNGVPRTFWRRVLVSLSVGVPVLVGLLLLFRSDLWLWFPRHKPHIWLLILIVYPTLSVYPQELIFRTFFFHRYHALFPTRAHLIGVNALCFGLAHVMFGNWVAPVMTVLGGGLFALTYARSHSTLLTFVEHSIWGLLLFTLGPGWFFYSGASLH